MTLGLEGPLLTLSLKPQRGKPYQLFVINNIIRDCCFRKCLGSRWFRHTIEILQERGVYALIWSCDFMSICLLVMWPVHVCRSWVVRSSWWGWARSFNFSFFLWSASRAVSSCFATNWYMYLWQPLKLLIDFYICMLIPPEPLPHGSLALLHLSNGSSRECCWGNSLCRWIRSHRLWQRKITSFCKSTSFLFVNSFSLSMYT